MASVLFLTYSQKIAGSPEKFLRYAGVQDKVRDLSVAQRNTSDILKILGFRQQETPVRKTSKTLLERETGIEPAYLAWKASVLPVSYTHLDVYKRQV